VVEDELLEMHESFVKLAPQSGARTSDGQKSHGADVSIQCHIELKSRMVRNSNGDEVSSEGRAMLVDAFAWVDENCRLTLPDGTRPPVVATRTTNDTSGPYQTYVYF